MKKMLLFLGLLLTSAMPLLAGHVTEQEALQKARQFMQDKHFAQNQSLRRSADATGFGSGAFYVFNADGEQGYVIVSADDRTESILAYSDKGRLDMNNLPENAKAWLESYARQVQALDGGATAAVANTQFQAIAPLLACQWGQDEPYNLLLPMDIDEKGKLVHCVTGCAATAMAQLMFFHKLPTAKAIPEYITESNGFYMPELPETTFNWDIIKAIYDDSDSEESRLEVAKLMIYCGQSIKMNYTAPRSDAMPFPEAFVDYFGYSKQARNVSRHNYTHTEWDQLMYNELSANRPVLYYGSGSSGAHEFVIDGCDNKGMFHINWGWDGGSDGYYLLAVANSSNPGITGSMSAQGFDSDQMAIIGLEKAQENEKTPIQMITYYPFMEQQQTYTRSSSSEEFKDIKLTFNCAFYAGAPQEYVDYAAAIYSGSQCIALKTIAENVATKDEFIPVTKNINIGGELAGGYNIKLMYRRNGTTEWRPADIFESPNSTPAVEPKCFAFNVGGNSLKLFVSSMYRNTENTKINSVKFSQRPMAGRPLTATINWSCLNLYNETDFYFFFEGATKYAGEVSSYQSFGETVDVDMVFEPKVAGEQNFFISSDTQGNTKLYSGTINLATPQQHSMIATPTINGQATQGPIATELNTTYFSGTATLKNTGTLTYDDFASVCVYKVDSKDKLVGTPKQLFYEVKLAPGEATTLTYDFEGLEKGERYYLMVEYYSKKNDKADDFSGEEKEAGYANITISPNATAVQRVRTTTSANCEYYSIDGRRLAQPKHGLNIIHMPDGTTRKIVKR